jgi:DNA invertase Pin-like site-specific DNA recombinase
VSKRRAIGIVRVSRVAGREGPSFASPDQQRERIEEECRRRDLKLLRVDEELEVSGGSPLRKRGDLRAAIEAIEDGQAEVIAVAYLDRLARSSKVEDEIVERVERVGGDVLAVDFGEMTNGGASRKLSRKMLGNVAEYHRDITGEKSREAQERAIARGVACWSNTPPGYERDKHEPYRPSGQAPIVQEAFRMRASGTTIEDCRDYLQANGIERSWFGVRSLFRNRVYRGEIIFGKPNNPKRLINPTAHEPLIDEQTFRRAQANGKRLGPQTKSTALLARQGVLRCGTCGSRMIISTQLRKNRKGTTTYRFYRCPEDNDCPDRRAIKADIAEQVVSDAVKVALADVEGRASAETSVREAEDELQRAQDALDGAIRTLADYADEPATKDTLDGLRAKRDAAEEQLERLGGTDAAVVVTAAGDWEDLTLEERRALIRATVKRAVVVPGKGRERITVELN